MPQPAKAKRRVNPIHDDYIKALSDLGYEFKLNLLDNSIEVNGERLTDVTAATIRDKMRDRGFKRYMSAMEDAYTHEAANYAYHPVRDYFAELKYDGGNYINQLATYFKDQHSVFHIYLRRWLIGAVAKAHRGTQNMMLVLEGPQNIGKSFFARWLCPINGMYLDSAISPDNKDDLINLISKFIWEVGELGATTRKADREALKGFITREVVTVRKPYGKYSITKPSLASFVGTFNNEAGILSDPTGNRRFNICSLTEIDWHYAHDIDVNSVWGEAQTAYQSGESWHLTPEEAKRQVEINKEFEVEDPIENLIIKHFTVTFDQGDWTATADIMSVLQNNGLTGNLKTNQMYLSTTLKKMGLEKYKFNGIWGYKGIK